MATFPLAYRNYLMKVDSAKKLARVLLETGGTVEEARPSSQHTAADAISLRGLPAVGRAVASVMPGTQPEAALLARERQRERSRQRTGSTP